MTDDDDGLSISLYDNNDNMIIIISIKITIVAATPITSTIITIKSGSKKSHRQTQ